MDDVLTSRAAVIVATLFCTACPRIVLPERDAGATIPPVVITDVAVLESRQHLVPPEERDLTIPVFAGDTLVVRGSGWDPVLVEVRVGTTPLPLLPGATADEVRGRIPQQPVEGQVTVISAGRPSAPSTSTVRYLGAGHLPALRFAGRVEPATWVTSVGVAGDPCPSHAEFPDGGYLVDDAGVPDCLALKDGSGMAISFDIGHVAEPRGPHFVLTELLGLATLQREQPRTPTPGETSRVTRIRAYGILDSTYAIHETYRVGDGAELTRIAIGGEGLWGVAPQTLFDGEKLLPFIMAYNEIFYAVQLDCPPGAVDLERECRHVLTVKHSLAPDLENLTTNAFDGVAHAAAMLDPAWVDGIEAGVGRVLFTMSCKRGSGDSLSVTTRRYDVSTNPIAIDFTLAMTRQYSAPPTGQNVELGGCFQDLCLPGNYFELRALDRGTLLLAPIATDLPPEAVQHGLCTVSTADGSMQPLVVSEDSFTAWTTLPADEPGPRTIVALPGASHATLGQLRPEMLVVRGLGTVERYATARRYRDVLVDKSLASHLIGVPLAGGFVDVMDLRATVVRTFSVLGPPQTVWPYPPGEGNILFVHPGVGMVAGVSGAIALSAELPTPGLPIVRPWDDVPRRLLSVRTHAGQPPAVELVMYDLGPTVEEFGKVVRTVRGGSQLGALSIEPYAFFDDKVAVRLSGRPPIPLPADCGSWLGLITLNADDSSSLRNIVDACHVRVLLADPVTRRVYFTSSTGSLEQDAQPTRVRIADLSGEEPALPEADLPWLVDNVDHGDGLASAPDGTIIGRFWDVDTRQFYLGGLSPALARYVIASPAPFAAAHLAVSPDGRRLYAGLDGRLLECALDVADGRYSLRVLDSLAVDGTPQHLRMDRTGSRLIYVDPVLQLSGLVQ